MHRSVLGVLLVPLPPGAPSAPQLTSPFPLLLGYPPNNLAQFSPALQRSLKILVSEVFKLGFGKALAAKGLQKERTRIEAPFGQATTQIMSSPEFSARYQKSLPLTESGYREISILLD